MTETIEWWTLEDMRDTCHRNEIFSLGFRTREDAIAAATEFLMQGGYELAYLDSETERFSGPVSVVVDECAVIGTAPVECRKLKKTKRTETVEHDGETFSRPVEDVEVLEDWAERTKKKEGRFPNYRDTVEPKPAERRLYLNHEVVALWDRPTATKAKADK